MDKRTVHKTEYRFVGVPDLFLIGSALFTSAGCSTALRGIVIAGGKFGRGMLNPSDDPQIGWAAIKTGSLGLQPSEGLMGTVG